MFNVARNIASNVATIVLGVDACVSHNFHTSCSKPAQCGWVSKQLPAILLVILLAAVDAHLVSYKPPLSLVCLLVSFERLETIVWCVSVL